MDYQGSAVDLSGDFTVAASNVITTLAFGKEVSVFSPSAQFVSSKDMKRVLERKKLLSTAALLA